MGFIFSKPVNYVKTKVTNTTQAVATKISDTKTAIVTKVSDTKTAVVNKVDNTKSGVVKGVTSVRDAIKAKIDAVVATVKRGCQAVHNKYTNIKNGVTSRCTRTKNRVNGTYRRIRDAKLTRWQKFKYALLTFVMLITAIVVTSISVDLYQGNQESAQAKIDTVCALFSFLWSYLQYFGENLYKAGRIGGKFALKAAATGGSHLWDGTKVVGAYTWEGTKVGAEYAWAGASSAGVVLAKGAVVVGENALYYSKIGAENFVEGSKVAADYGWYGISVGSVKFYEGSKVFFQNAAIWAQEGSVWLWEASKTMAVGLATGSVSFSQVVMDVSAFMADKAYWTSLFIAEYTKWFAFSTWKVICAVSSFTGNWTVVIAQGIYDGTIWLSMFTYDFCTSFSIWLYRFSISLADVIARKSISTMRFLWSWTYYVSTEGTKGLYVGFNKIGVRSFIALTKKLGAWSLILGEIMWKFINDLVVYTGNFLYVLGVHIYNILYIVIAFVLQIVTGVMVIIKMIIGGLVAVVTFIFGGIIWLLEEFSGAYMFALHKYNMYREFLFIGFLGLMALYCMGVMRDRRISSEEEVDGLESSDEDERIGLPDEIDADEELTGIKKTPPVAQVVRTPSGRLKNLPPIYEERRKLPAYSKNAMASSESSDDLGLGSDQDVPDVLNSSLDSDGFPSGDERDRVQNVPRSVRQRNVPAQNAPGSPRRELVQPVQSQPRSPQSGSSPSAAPPVTAVRPESPRGSVGPGGDASIPQVTMASAPSARSEVQFTAKPQQDALVKPQALAQSPTPSARPEPANRPRQEPVERPMPKPEPVSRPTPQQESGPLAPAAVPVGQQGRVEPGRKPVVQPDAPKPSVPLGQQSKTEPAQKPVVPAVAPKPTVPTPAPKPSEPLGQQEKVEPGRKPFGQPDAPKPSSSPGQRRKMEPPKPSVPKADAPKVIADSKRPEPSKSLQEEKPVAKVPPAGATQPKSALHEKLAQFDAEKSKQTVVPPQKSEAAKAPAEASLSPSKSKPLSTSPKDSKVSDSKPIPASPSGFQSPTRRQAPKMSPVGSPTKPRVGLSKSPPSKSSEAAKTPTVGVEEAQKLPTKIPSPASPSKTASAPKPIPGSASKPSPSSASSASPGGVSPPSKSGASPPAAAAETSTSPASPSKRGSSIRMLQQRLNQGQSETTRPGGVRVRVADPSTSPKKS